MWIGRRYPLRTFPRFLPSRRRSTRLNRKPSPGLQEIHSGREQEALSKAQSAPPSRKYRACSPRGRRARGSPLPARTGLQSKDQGYSHKAAYLIPYTPRAVPMCLPRAFSQASSAAGQISIRASAAARRSRSASLGCSGAHRAPLRLQPRRRGWQMLGWRFRASVGVSGPKRGPVCSFGRRLLAPGTLAQRRLTLRSGGGACQRRSGAPPIGPACSCKDGSRRRSKRGR